MHAKQPLKEDRVDRELKEIWMKRDLNPILSYIYLSKHYTSQ